jgi:hypothetical protein
MKRFGKWTVGGLAAGVAVCVGCRSLKEEPLSAGCAFPPALTLYVSADGPLATLEAARQRIRELKAKGPLPAGGVEVVVRGGTYYLPAPFVLAPEDSGTADAPIVYRAAPGERVVLSGGRRIAGWKKTDDRLWATGLPDVKAGDWFFSQLFVNGQPRSRTRLPKTGFFLVAKQIPDAPSPDGGNAPLKYNTPCHQFGYAPGDWSPAWTNLQDVDVTVYHFWTDTHLKVKAVDSDKNIVSFVDPAAKQFVADAFSIKPDTPGARYIVENVFEALDEPGEWYLNRSTGVLYYWPKPGEDMTRAEVVAPRLTALVQVCGEPAKQRAVEHVTFRGLSFKHCHYEVPPGSVNNVQASATVAPAIQLVGARCCALENCEVSQIGGYAVELLGGCRDNRFVGNHLHDLDAGGFRVTSGDFCADPVGKNPKHLLNPWWRTAGNVITDNVICHYGKRFASAVGVLLMHTEGNTVAHNQIHHGYYSGVSVGWRWGYWRSISRDNRIEFNHIHDIGQGLLSDMGGIYTLGVSPGTTLRNNLIHDVNANHYGGWGIYFDEGSTHILAENNVVYRTKFAPFDIHYAKECTVRNNVFALGRMDQLARTWTEPHESVYFEGNIVYWKEGKLFKGNWKDTPYLFHGDPKTPEKRAAKRTSTSTFDWNVYFNPTQQCEEVVFDGGTWKEWQKRGKDVNSVYADPLFVDPDQGDFRLKPESPAWVQGFRPIDMSRVGPRPQAAREMK